MTMVKTLFISRIADYVNNIVATRVIPAGKKGVVVMKLDVEVVTALKLT